MVSSKGFISVFLKYPVKRIDFHNVGEMKIKSLPTEKQVKRIPIVPSTHYLQVPWERLHLKVVLVTHIRISCLSILLTRYFSNRIYDQKTSTQHSNQLALTNINPEPKVETKESITLPDVSHSHLT